MSRADFLNEMRDPTKAQAVFQFCDRWSLVTPVGLVKAEELPEPWGLMTFDGRTMRTVKSAPKLVPVPLTPGFVAAMLRRAGEADDAILGAAIAAERARLDAMFEKRLQDSLIRDREHRMRKAGDGVEKLAAYENLFGDMPSYQIEAMAPLMKVIEKIGIVGGWSSARHMMTTLEKSAREIREAVERFDRPAGPFDDLLG